MQDQLDARAAAEVRLEQVTGADGVARRRAEPGHSRLVATTVGRVQVTRIAYHAPGTGNLRPADKLLSLPERMYSFPLQRHVVHEVAGGSLRAAREAVIRGTGQHLGTRQLMHIAVEAAADVRDFYRQIAGPSTSPGSDPTGGRRGDLLVLSVDATGVNMIGSDLREPVDADERAARQPGPKTSNRKVDASIEYSVAPMVAALFDQAESRDPHHRRRWVVLVDGANHQLECLEREAQRRGVQIDVVVDLIHVIEYLWKADDDLHPTPPAPRSSKPPPVSCWKATPHGWSPTYTLAYAPVARGNPAPGLQRAAAYLEAKAPYLNYHIALALGWPIATGVIEGCCRYLVKDRLDITGARWSLTSAEAILLLRAVVANGDFHAYW